MKKIFISYSHNDKDYLDELLKHLSPLKREGLIGSWIDRQIKPGKDWKNEINDNLINCDIAILLVSPDFISSDFCYNIEYKTALRLHREGKIILVPIIIRPCNWKKLELSKIQALPTDGKAVSTWKNIDQAWLDVSEGIEQLCSKELISNDNKKIEINIGTKFIVCELPRGFIILSDIIKNKSSNWSVLASYYNWDGKWINSTHYHSSYYDFWKTEEGLFTQCIKLGIPKGDIGFAENAISLMLKIRDEKNKNTLEYLVDIFNSETCQISIQEGKYLVDKTNLSTELIELQNTGDIRDLYFKVDFMIEETNLGFIELDKIRIDSIIRETQLLFFNKVGKNHPAYELISNHYDKLSNKKYNQFEWLIVLRNIIEDAYQYF